MVIPQQTKSNCSYKDHFDVNEEDNQGLCNVVGKSDSSFPSKLHYMMSELEKEGINDVISWQPHGRSFVILNRKKLEETVLP